MIRRSGLTVENQNSARVAQCLEMLLRSATEPMNDLFVELDTCGILFGDGSYVVVQFAPDAEDLQLKDQPRSVYIDKLVLLVDSIMTASQNSFSVISGGKVVCIIYFPRASQEAFVGSPLDKIQRDCESLAEQFFRQHEIRLFVSISKLYARAVNISTAYHSSQDILDYCLFSKSHKIMREDSHADKKRPVLTVREQDESFARSLLSSDGWLPEPEKLTACVLEYLDEQSRPFMSYFQQRFQSVMEALCLVVKQHALADNPEEAFPDPGQINEMTTWRRLAGQMSEQFSALFPSAPRLSQRTGKVGQAQRYIEENFKNPNLSVTMVSDALGVNQSHLSSLFKKTTGINMSDYIHLARVKAAKELLAGSDTPIAVLAQRVGYTNPSTFYRVFRRFEKSTPNKLRRGAIAAGGE